MARRDPPRVPFFEPVPPRLARNTVLETTSDVGRRFRCTMRVDCGQLDPETVIRRTPANGRRTCLRGSTRKSWPTGAPAETRFTSWRLCRSGCGSRLRTHKPKRLSHFCRRVSPNRGSAGWVV